MDIAKFNGPEDGVFCFTNGLFWEPLNPYLHFLLHGGKSICALCLSYGRMGAPLGFLFIGLRGSYLGCICGVFLP